MVVVDILELIDGAIWIGPMTIAKALRDYRTERQDYQQASPEISRGLAEDAVMHCVSYAADLDSMWIAECFQWPARVVRKVREYKSTGGIDLRGEAAVLEGILDGLIKLHHLPSIAEYELHQDEFDYEMEKRDRATETHLDKLTRNVRRTTMLAGTAAYAALVYYWTPWAITPLIANNVADVAFVTVCPREDMNDPALM